VSYPLPGTPFHDRVKDRLKATNWSGAMENAVLWEADYPQPFYDAARELLRAEHAILRFRPDLSRTGARRALGAAYHLARWPVQRGKLSMYARKAASTRETP
jgi:hypothetical protein